MSAIYNELEFKTTLEARWAAFFDLAGWSWWYNPIAIDDWRPDFRVTFPCTHSECGGSHTLLASVLPVANPKALEGHPALNHSYFVKNAQGLVMADGGALLGISPSATWWEISHGAGGGEEDMNFRVDDADALWNQAGSLVSNAVFLNIQPYCTDS